MKDKDAAKFADSFNKKMHLEKQKIQQKWVQQWIYAGVGMLIIQILLGGITRLTGSGLSITEWDVVTGALPPFADLQWQKAFGEYKETPQFKLLNSNFTLANFKFIFFWEWMHRFWARFMGLIFIAGFIYFLAIGAFTRRMVFGLVILFLLGAMQGLVGWIMVASGLTSNAIYVKPTKLALHFVFAIALLCYTYWFLLSLNSKNREVFGKNKIPILLVLCTIFLLFSQLGFGAILAGYKAAAIAPNWPQINGQWFPNVSQFAFSSFQNFLAEPLLMHFFHRCLGYAIWLLAGCTYLILKQRFTIPFKKMAATCFILCNIQILLGILSLLFSSKIVPNVWGGFEWMALLHQANALLFVLATIKLLHHLICNNQGKAASAIGPL